MAYPDFDDPMYEKLRDLSAELFLPNLQLIPPNTISLLMTNPPFIESYMVGLNHEFGTRAAVARVSDRPARQLLPAVLGRARPDRAAADARSRRNSSRQMYQDIVPLDTLADAPRARHAQAAERPKTGDLVLTIRGELLKKYPNTLVYAQKAHMARNRIRGAAIRR